ncbi:MAG TPA: diacylglycerol O-acyltransferase [Actinobacteria bacterium]|nr:diacylglycerol O-acyltransferase [Actinomycetota bacterium]
MTVPGNGYMRASDAFSWYMERDPALRSTVVAVIWLGSVPDWDELAALIGRMSRFMPSLRQRVVEPPFRLTTPRWADDPHFDLNWHLRRVTAPAPHTRAVVLQLARLSAMDAFDRDRPLWELTLVDGIEGGGAALVLKLHHSLADGVGGMRMLAVMLDLQREPSDLGEMQSAPLGERLDLRALVAGAVGSVAGRSAYLAQRGAQMAIPALMRYARDPVGRIRGTAAMARSIYRTAAPILDTKSPIMRERAMTRHLAMMEVSLDTLKRAAMTVGGTVNDAYLAAVTGGLRRYHERHDMAIESLRVVMPISLRTESDTSWGNKITLQRLTVRAGEPDPATRMRLLHHVTETARKEPSLSVTDVIAGALNLLPASYVGGVLKHIDFLASNVPGIPVPVYLAGAKITGFFAFGPTIGAALNTTLVSYAGTCHIGINIDTAAIPDPDVLLECLRESFDEITALGTAGQVPTG